MSRAPGRRIVTGPSAPIGDGNGTRKGCLEGLVFVLIVLFVFGAVAAVVAAGVSAIQNQPQPTSSTSTRSTP